MAKWARNAIGNFDFDGAMLARATYPKLRLEYRSTGHDAGREFSVTMWTICAPLDYWTSTLRAVSFERWLFVFRRMTKLF